MIKNMTKLEVLIDGKQHIYSCEQDSNLVQCKEALFQFLKYIGQVEDASRKAQEEEKKEAEIPQEDPKIESIG